MNLLALAPLNAWLVYFGVLWSVVYIITMSVIFGPVRHALGTRNYFLLQLVHCPTCISFWVGLFLGGIGFFPLDLALPVRMVLAPLLSLAFSSVMMAWLYHGHTPTEAELEMLVEHMVLKHPEKIPEFLRGELQRQQRAREENTTDESPKEKEDE